MLCDRTPFINIERVHRTLFGSETSEGCFCLASGAEISWWFCLLVYKSCSSVLKPAEGRLPGALLTASNSSQKSLLDISRWYFGIQLMFGLEKCRNWSRFGLQLCLQPVPEPPVLGLDLWKLTFLSWRTKTPLPCGKCLHVAVGSDLCWLTAANLSCMQEPMVGERKIKSTCPE